MIFITLSLFGQGPCWAWTSSARVQLDEHSQASLRGVSLLPSGPPEGARALPTRRCICACALTAARLRSPPNGSRPAAPRPASPRAGTLLLGCPRLPFVDFLERGDFRCPECPYGSPRGFHGPSRGWDTTLGPTEPPPPFSRPRRGFPGAPSAWGNLRR